MAVNPGDSESGWFHDAAVEGDGLMTCGTIFRPDRLHDGFVTRLEPDLRETGFRVIATEGKDVPTSMVLGPDNGIYVAGRSARNPREAKRAHWTRWYGWLVRLAETRQDDPSLD